MPENKLKLTSTVVVSQSFLKEQERREKARERRLNRFRRSESDDEAETRSNRQDRDRRERRRSERESPRRGRKDSDRDENENRGWQRERNGGRFRAADRSGRQQGSVFERLDKGDVKSRLGKKEFNAFNAFEQRDEGEVVSDPTEVPRGQRYFEHDDREGPRGRFIVRGPPMRMRRGRSRSPVWKHDMFDKVQQDNEEEPKDDTQEMAQREPEARRSSRWQHDKYQENEQDEKRKPKEKESRRRENRGWRRRNESD